MNKPPHIPPTLRTWLLAGIWACVVAGVCAWVLVPYAGRLLRRGDAVRKDFSLAANSTDVVARLSATLKEINLADSVLTVLDSRPVMSQAALLETLYQMSDSSGCRSAKVEAGQGIVAGNSTEMPFLITGEGAYTSVGKFLEGIENLPMSTRVRSVVMKRIKDGETGFSLDFVVLE